MRYVVLLLFAILRVGIITISVATMATLLAKFHWLADLAANLRVQQFIALVPLLALGLLMKHWYWAMVAGLCMVVHLPWLCPTSWGEELPARHHESLTITLANVLTSNRRYRDIVDDVSQSQPDVLVILELSTNFSEYLSKANATLYPYRIERPMDSGNFGIGLYSRYPIIQSDIFELNTEIESIEAMIDADGQVYRIMATHPLPPMGGRGFHLRNEHLRLLSQKIGNVQPDPVAMILVGDFNLTPWSPYFHELEVTTNLRRSGNQLSFVPTWYAFDLFPGGLMLDHVMISHDLVCTAHRVGNEMGSDHRSVTVEVARRGGND